MALHIDPSSGALVNRRTPEQKAIRELKLENQKLKALLMALLKAQPEEIRNQIPAELIDD